jgi:subtilisin family serine protease
MSPANRSDSDTDGTVELTKREFVGGIGAGLLPTTGSWSENTGTTTTTPSGNGGGGGGGGSFDADAPTQSDVTLITGHTIRVTEYEDHRTYEAVGGVEGPEAFDIVETERGTLVRPTYVDSSVYHDSLFNIDLLVEQGYTDEQWDTQPVFVRGDEATAGALATDGVTTFRSTDVMAMELTKPDAGAADRDVFQQPPVEQMFLDAQAELFPDDYDDAINAPAARQEFGVTGDGVVVGIVDSGIDGDHPDLKDETDGDRIIEDINVSSDDTAEDLFGHGTSVAGVVGGDGSVDEDVLGIAPDVQFHDLKAFGEDGSAAFSEVVEAVEFGVFDAEPQPDILNLSLGGPILVENDPIVQAVNTAVDEGVFCAVAAGNENSAFFSSYESLTSPGNAEQVTTVGATDRTGDEPEIAGFSSWGPTPFEQRLKPEVVAPGVNITTTGGDGQTLTDPTGGFPYRDISGTSFSTPMVAGMAALLLENFGELEPATIEDHAVTTANPISGIAASDPYQQGAGEVDILSALETDVVVRDAVADLGVVTEPSTTETTIAVDNIGDEEVELDVTATAYDIENEVINEDVLSAPDTVTIDAGETQEITLTANLEYGRWGGVVTLEGENNTYRALVGVTVAVPVEFRLLQNEDSALDTAAGQLAFANSYDGEISESVTISADNTASFLMFRESATFDLWALDELEPEGDQLAGNPVFAIETGVEYDAGTDTVELDANSTSRRGFDRDTLPDDGPFQAGDVAFELYHTATVTSYSRSFAGDFGVFDAFYSPVETETPTNIGISNVFAPEGQVPDEPFADVLQSPTAYHLVDTSQSHPADGELLDKNITTLDLDYYFWVADRDSQHSPAWFPADSEEYPKFFAFTFVQSLTDSDDQVWYLTEDSQYSYTWYDDGFIEANARYDFTTPGIGLVPPAGAELQSRFGYTPITPEVDNWTYDAATGTIETVLYPHVDQGTVPITPYDFDFANSNELTVSVNGDSVGTLDWFTSSLDVSVSGLNNGDVVRVENSSNVLDQPPLNASGELIHEVTVGTSTTAPPEINGIEIPELSRENELNAGQTVAVVEAETPSAFGLRDVTGFYETGSAVDSLEDEFIQAETLYEDQGTAVVRIDATEFDGDELAIGAAVTDAEGNRTVASSTATPVVEYASVSTDLNFTGPARPGRLAVTLTDVDAADVDTESLRFGAPDTVYDGGGATPISAREVAGQLQVQFPVAGTGLPTNGVVIGVANASTTSAITVTDGEIEPVLVTGETTTGDRLSGANAVLVVGR